MSSLPAALGLAAKISTIIVGGTSHTTTIQQGILAAQAAGALHIVVEPGTYVENDILTSASNGLTISAPEGGAVLQGTIAINGASQITISGLSIRGDGSSTAIQATGGVGIVISDDSFAGTGEAIVLDGTGSSKIVNNLFTNTTNSVIELKDGATGNLLSSNLINGSGAPDTIGAIWLHGASSTTIAHNEIINTTGAAISLADFSPPGDSSTQNNNSIVENNFIEQVDTQSQDSGAIYVLGRSQNPATNIMIRANYVGPISFLGSQHAVAIYLDDNASGVTVTRNIVQAVPSTSDPYEIHGGSNNLINSNIFDLGTGQTTFGLFQADQADQAPQGSFRQLQNDSVKGNVFTTESTAPHDPGFGDLTTGIGSITIAGNDFWAFSGAALNVSGIGPTGDRAARYSPPAPAPAQSLSDYAGWSGAGIGFTAIVTSQIGLAPSGPHPY